MSIRIAVIESITVNEDGTLTVQRETIQIPTEQEIEATLVENAVKILSSQGWTLTPPQQGTPMYGGIE